MASCEARWTATFLLPSSQYPAAALRDEQVRPRDDGNRMFVRDMSTTVIDELAASRNIRQIATWAAFYELSSDEVARLSSVLTDYAPTDHERELREELRCIVAARTLASRPKLTNEAVDKAREAFTSGRVPFVPQDMD